MKNILLVSIALLLTACSSGTQSASVKELLDNPLFAERYSEDVVLALTELEIQQSPLLEDESTKKYVDRERAAWLKKAKSARTAQREGTSGIWIPVESFARGEVLFLDSQIHLGPGFEVTTTPGLHLYLTSALDPRDEEFPDSTSIDLGAIKSPYGAQSYKAPKAKPGFPLRTIVLWDPKLKQLVAFAQLRE